jgi:DNA-binding protein H-NS
MERRAAELGISADDLFFTAGQRAPAEQAAGKMASARAAQAARRHRRQACGQIPWPNGEEWSGRGRMPKWLAALEAEGRGREEF